MRLKASVCVCVCVCVWKHEAYTDFDKSEAPAEDEAPIESHVSSSSLIGPYFRQKHLKMEVKGERQIHFWPRLNCAMN